jgi:hypothetical protein
MKKLFGKLKEIFINSLALMSIKTIFVNDAHEIVSEEGWKKLKNDNLKLK